MSTVRRLQTFVTPPPLNLELVNVRQEQAGDILLYKSSGDFMFGRISENPNINMEECTPIGVVVIPTQHRVYGAEQCAVMSLVRMQVGSPEGSVDPSAVCEWGGAGHDVEGVPNYTQAFCVADTTSDFGSVQTPQNSRDLTGIVPFLPSDIYDTDVKNPYAPEGMNSYGPNSNLAYLGPSPYLADGSFNGLIQTTNPSSSCYSDFSGNMNTTNIMIDPENHPIADVAYSFSTPGTTPGDWYIPAAGEMLYLVAAYGKIMKSMEAIKKSGYRCCPIQINETFHTSTEYNADYMVHVYVYSHFAEISASWGKTSALDTRAFYRI